MDRFWDSRVSPFSALSRLKTPATAPVVLPNAFFADAVNPVAASFAPSLVEAIASVAPGVAAPEASAVTFRLNGFIDAMENPRLEQPVIVDTVVPAMSVASAIRRNFAGAIDLVLRIFIERFTSDSPEGVRLPSEFKTSDTQM